MPRKTWTCQLVQRSFTALQQTELKERLVEILEILLQPKSQPSIAFSKVSKSRCGRSFQKKGS